MIDEDTARVPERSDRMSRAEFRAWRHLLGLTMPEIALMLGNKPETVRWWERGRDPIPYGVRSQIFELVNEHDQLVAAYLGADATIGIRRDDEDAQRPRGWYVAAAARALAVEPDLMVEWV